MKFGTAIGIMVVTPVVVVLWLWSKDLIQQEYHTYRYEKKMDQVYEQFLGYGPEFMGEWWDITESYFQTWETRRTVFDDEAKSYYRDIKNKKVYERQYPGYDYGDAYLLTRIDYNTFTPLSYQYYKDKDNIYYRNGNEEISYDIRKHPRLVGQYFVVDDEYVYIKS